MFQKLCAGMPGRKTKSRKGFTLAELLIVVAIVAILVAIAIPVFSASLDKSKAAVDAANLRSANAVASAYCLTEKQGDWSKVSADTVTKEATDAGVPTNASSDSSTLAFDTTAHEFKYGSKTVDDFKTAAGG